MTRSRYASGDLSRLQPRRLRGGLAAPSAGAALALALWGGLSPLQDAPARTPPRQAVAAAPVRTLAALSPADAWLLDPKPLLGSAGAGLRLAGASARPQRLAMAAPLVPPVPPRPERARLVPPLLTAELGLSKPLPVPRPPEMAAPEMTPRPAEPPRLAETRPARRARQTRMAAAQTAPEDNRSFFEKLFGVQLSSGPALSYASLDQGPLRSGPASRVSPGPGTSAGTAIYDISARMVYLPNGERLEAHSGLGDKLDDPRFAHVSMKGVTPPGTYDLTEREKLFHGVRALRLNPVGGPGTIYGRVGLLAHTFMLGPNGDSNGCVSFRDYNRFLQAFLRGEVRRLVVVAGGGQDAVPPVASRRNGRTASRGGEG